MSLLRSWLVPLLCLWPLLGSCHHDCPDYASDPVPGSYKLTRTDGDLTVSDATAVVDDGSVVLELEDENGVRWRVTYRIGP